MAAQAPDVVTAEDVGFSSERLSKVDEVMRRFVDEERFAGSITLVSRHGRIANFCSTGLMDREAGRPMEHDAIFRLASMTKPIAITAVMMLLEEGRFHLHQPIADFLPEYANAKVFLQEAKGTVDITDLERPITIQHLLMHTSGIAYDWSHPLPRLYEEAEVGRPDRSLADLVHLLATLPLAHQPGERWTYGHSHDVLARLVEVITGQSFDAFLRHRIFEPLEMGDTGFQIPSQQLHRLATVYITTENGGIERAGRSELDSSNEYHARVSAGKSPVTIRGSSCLASTAADYARFCQMLLNGGVLGNTRLLRRDSVDLMTANHWTGTSPPLPPGFPGSPGHGFGLGMRVMANPSLSDVPSSVGEYGWAGSWSTYFWIDPAEDMFGVLMLQLEPTDFDYGKTLQTLTYQALVA